MTREQLEDYQNIVAEIADLQNYLHTIVSDTVKDGSSGYPHSIQIRGLPAGERERKRIDELIKQKRLIEKWVDMLPTAQDRRLCQYRMNGYGWNDVASKMGYRYSVDSVKKTYYRLFKKYI